MSNVYSLAYRRQRQSMNVDQKLQELAEAFSKEVDKLQAQIDRLQAQVIALREKDNG